MERIEGRRIPWKKGERFERVGRFSLKSSAVEIFPLLCPVLEYEWLPGWACAMVYSDSGVAEKDAVFFTREVLGRRAVWTTVTYEAPSLIEYLIVSGSDTVVRLRIELEGEGEGSTRITWIMRFTACSRLGRFALSRHFSQEKFDAMMKARQGELSAYLGACRT
jgi:hypothetical protein